MTTIDIVDGEGLKEDYSNLIENFQSNIIPRIGDTIITINGAAKVNNVIIDYTEVQKFKEIGKETIYVMVSFLYKKGVDYG